VVQGRGKRPLLQEVASEEAECEEDLRAQLEELEEHREGLACERKLNIEGFL
jgi:hypothetical protein